ncbi:isoprenylcysteine carboxylmethyltransferase family protein [Candidatus Thorarchaeota archaeon]|nr:MAG: isoprenylcysteine carboxylmethyltransferase family protein [Candidatus Thorarchaeota archaeon]
MIDNATLRLITVVLLAFSFLLIYRLNAHDDQAEGRFEVKKEILLSPAVELAGNVVTIAIPMIAVILLLLSPTAVYGTGLNIHFYGDALVQVAGILLYTSGATLLTWSSRVLGKYDTGRIAVAEDHVLVDAGPYARVRHPGYTATFMLVLSVFMMTLHVLFLLDVLAAVAYFLYRSRLEEELMLSDESLGDDYQEYMERTGRFFPQIRNGAWLEE